MTTRQHPKDEPEEPTEAPEEPAKGKSAKEPEWPGGKPLTSNETGQVPEEERSATKLREES